MAGIQMVASMMAGAIVDNYYEAVSMALFFIGFITLFINRNLVKKIIGLNIADTAVWLFLAAKGYISGRAAPIIRDGIVDASVYINPIPAGLILTGIVISVSVTAFSLSLVVSLYKKYDTLNLDDILRQAAMEDE